MNVISLTYDGVTWKPSFKNFYSDKFSTDLHLVLQEAKHTF